MTQKEKRNSDLLHKMSKKHWIFISQEEFKDWTDKLYNSLLEIKPKSSSYQAKLWEKNKWIFW